jgi:hypothetical protein
MRIRIPFAVLAAAALAPAAAAQLPVLFVTDATNDKVWRLADLNADGDYNDAGEVANWYSDTGGTIALTNNVGCHNGPDGAVGISDTSEDSIVLFRDYNNDVDAQDDGEYSRFFDGRAGGNASGVLMISANSLTYDRASGAWYAASANTSTGNDAILRVIDLNNDGDANDAGEAVEFWTAPAGPTGDYLPNAVLVAPDGSLYYAESGTTGVTQKGIYRLQDLNSDGDANDAGERTAFFIPPAAATPFYWSVKMGPDGWCYTEDTGNDTVWRFKDLNGDGDAQDPGEFTAFWQVIGTTSNMWDSAIAADNSVYVCDFQPVSRITRLLDLNNDGDALDPGEAVEVYNETTSGIVIGNPRGMDVAGPAAAGTGFCFGDGTATACPCGVNGTEGKGCPNSLFASGARLETRGDASVGNDTLALIGTRMPNSSALYFQGTAQQNGGLGAVFGDGLRCAGGAVIRLGTKFNVANASRYPDVGDLAVSVRGLVAPGDVRAYQTWYRNADPAFCTASTFNLTNGITLSWQP